MVEADPDHDMTVSRIHPSGKMTLDEIRKNALENARVHLQSNAGLVFARAIISG